MSKLTGLIASTFFAFVIGFGAMSATAQVAAAPDALKVIIGGTTFLDFVAANEQQQSVSMLQFAPLPNGFMPGTIFLTEPANDIAASTIQSLEGMDVSKKRISDALSFNGSLLRGRINVFFVSDGSSSTDLANFPIFARTMNLLENGKAQDVSAFFGLQKGSIVVTSDVPSIPELATWAMMILGFGLVALRLRSRGRVAA